MRLNRLKHDGYRTLLAVQRGSVVAYTRNGFDWTDRYPQIVEAAARLHCKSAMLDGEVIVQDPRGASDFEALQAALRSKRTPLIFYAFDLLHLDGKDCRNLPLVERRAKLKLLVEAREELASKLYALTHERSEGLRRLDFVRYGTIPSP